MVSKESYAICKNVYGDISIVFFSNSLISIAKEWSKQQYEYPYYFVSVYNLISAKGETRQIPIMDIDIKVLQTYDIDEVVCEVEPPTYGNKAW